MFVLLTYLGPFAMFLGIVGKPFPISNLNLPFHIQNLNTWGQWHMSSLTPAPMKFFLTKLQEEDLELKPWRLDPIESQWHKVPLIHIQKVLTFESQVFDKCAKRNQILCLPIRNPKLNISTNEIKATEIKLSDKHQLNLWYSSLNSNLQTSSCNHAIKK